MKKAVFDLGSNTFNLLIGEFGDMGWEIALSQKWAVKFGHKTNALQHLLTPASFERGYEALREMLAICEREKVDEIKAVGTAAFRRFKNIPEFCQKVKSDFGLEIEVISGDREAELVYQGVAPSMETLQNFLIIDIGGGSVEFILGNKEAIFWQQSLPIGIMEIHSHVNPSNPPTEQNKKDTFAFIESHCNELRNAIQEYSPEFLIGCSGSFDTFYEIMHYPKKAKGNNILNLEGFRSLAAQLFDRSIEGRMQIPGMTDFRSEFIATASLLTLHVLEMGIPQLLQAQPSLKEGLMNEIHKTYVENSNR